MRGLVALVEDLLDQRGVLLHPFAHQEECRPGPAGPEGIDGVRDVRITPDGYVIWKAQPSQTPSGSIQVRVTADGISDVITIPVQFQ